MLVPPHFLVSTAFKKMKWKDEFRKWLPKFSICEKKTVSFVAVGADLYSTLVLCTET